MSQQQHPRLRRVDFPNFPLYVESTVHDLKTGYQSYARTSVEFSDGHEVRFEAGEPLASNGVVRRAPVGK